MKTTRGDADRIEWGEFVRTLAPCGFQEAGPPGERAFVCGVPSRDVVVAVHTGLPAGADACAVRHRCGAVRVMATDARGRKRTYPMRVGHAPGYADRAAEAARRLEVAFLHEGEMVCPRCSRPMTVRFGCRDKEPYYRCVDRTCLGARAAGEACLDKDERLAFLRFLAGEPLDAPTCRCGATMVQRVREGDLVRFWGCVRWPYCAWACSLDHDGWARWAGVFWEDGRWWRPRPPSHEAATLLYAAGYAHRFGRDAMIFAKERDDLDATFWVSTLTRTWADMQPVYDLSLGFRAQAANTSRHFQVPARAGWGEAILRAVRELEGLVERARPARCPSCGRPVVVRLRVSDGAPYHVCSAAPGCAGLPVDAEDLKHERLIGSVRAVLPGYPWGCP